MIHINKNTYTKKYLLQTYKTIGDLQPTPNKTYVGGGWIATALRASQ